MEPSLTPDTQTVLLLCGELGQSGGDGLKPLGRRHYNALASWLNAQGMRPAELLSVEGRVRLTSAEIKDVETDRVTGLLDRGAALALVLEKWERSGLWVISRSDSAYPERLKRYMGQARRHFSMESEARTNSIVAALRWSGRATARKKMGSLRGGLASIARRKASRSFPGRLKELIATRCPARWRVAGGHWECLRMDWRRRRRPRSIARDC